MTVIVSSLPDPCLALPYSLYPSSFRTKILYEILISPMRATCPNFLIVLHKNLKLHTAKQLLASQKEICFIDLFLRMLNTCKHWGVR